MEWINPDNSGANILVYVQSGWLQWLQLVQLVTRGCTETWCWRRWRVASCPRLPPVCVTLKSLPHTTPEKMQNPKYFWFLRKAFQKHTEIRPHPCQTQIPNQIIFCIKYNCNWATLLHCSEYMFDMKLCKYWAVDSTRKEFPKLRLQPFEMTLLQGSQAC